MRLTLDCVNRFKISKRINGPSAPKGVLPLSNMNAFKVSKIIKLIWGLRPLRRGEAPVLLGIKIALGFKIL